jgi:CheY-like chemotaxis protein
MTTVFVIDDDRPLLRLVSMILRSDDFEVEISHEPEEALELLGQHHPDVIVLDLSMPGMDGREFYAAARDLGYHGPVLICSAYGAAAAGRQLGADASLDKPFTPEQLLSVIHRLLPCGAG